jgi:hypothetical protein
MTARGLAFAEGKAREKRPVAIKLKSTRDLVMLVSSDASRGRLKYVARLARATHFEVRSRVRHNEKAVRRIYHRAQL